MGKNQFQIEIFVYKFENFLKNCKFFIDFLTFFENFRVWKRRKIFDFSNVKKDPHCSRDPPPIREILYKLLIGEEPFFIWVPISLSIDSIQPMKAWAKFGH